MVLVPSALEKFRLMAWIGPWEVWKVDQLTGLDSSFPFFLGGESFIGPWGSLVLFDVLQAFGSA